VFLALRPGALDRPVVALGGRDEIDDRLRRRLCLLFAGDIIGERVLGLFALIFS